MKMNRQQTTRMRLALVIVCAVSASIVSAKEPKTPASTHPPAGTATAGRPDLKQLAKAFEAVTTGMTRVEIEKAVGAPGKRQNKAYDLKVGNVTGVMIEDGKVTGSWSSGDEQKIISKIALGMGESEARRLLAGRPIAKCEIYRWGTDESPFDVSFADGKAVRVSRSQIP